MWGPLLREGNESFGEWKDSVASGFSETQGKIYAGAAFVGEVAPNLIPVAGAEEAGGAALSKLEGWAADKIPGLSRDLFSGFEQAGAALEREAAQRALQLPATDASLSGTRTLGYTTPQGEVFLQPGLSHAEQEYVLRHESVHAFFTPEGSGPLTTFRQNLGQWGYDNSAFLNATEEMIAETHASGSLFKGIGHAFSGSYSVRGDTAVTPWNFIGEGAAGVGAIGGLGVGGYYIGNSLFGPP